MKKLLALILALTMVTVSMAACSAPVAEESAPESEAPTGSSEAEETEADGEMVPIRLVSISTDANQTSILEDHIKANIAEALPNVEMEYEPGGGGEDFTNKLKTYNATNDLPDVWYGSSDTAFPIMAAGNQVDFTEYLDDAFLSQYNNAELLKFHDGGIHALSSGADSYFTPKLFYNKDIFAELGIEELPTTWDEFIAVCDTIAASEYTPVSMMGKGGWTPQLFLVQTMAQLHDPDSIKNLLSNSGDFTDPAILEGVKKIQQLVDGGYLPDGVANLDYGPAVEMFTSGDAAILMMFSWEVANIGTNEFAGLMDWPQMVDGVDSTDVMQVWGSPLNGYSVYANSENVEMAVEVAKFCVQQEANFYAGSGSPTNLAPTVEMLAPGDLMVTNLEMYDAATDKINSIMLNCRPIYRRHERSLVRE